ncbi:adhesion G-protein coupled receptor F1-like [Discoglossus pictus]
MARMFSEEEPGSWALLEAVRISYKTSSYGHIRPQKLMEVVIPLLKAPACYIPFIANGMTYTSCTNVGQTRGYWCSTTDNFDRDGLWSWCTGPGSNSYLACYFPFLNNGLLYSHCLPDAKSGDTWCSITANYDRDRQGIYCISLDEATSDSSTIPRTSSSYSAISTTPEPLEKWLQLSSLNDSAAMGLGIIQDLRNYTSSINTLGFDKDQVQLILHILGNITENAIQANQTFSESIVMDILFIANQFLNDSSWSLASTGNHVLGPQLLQCFENILSGMAMTNHSFKISYENIELECLASHCNDMKNDTAMRLESNVSASLTLQDSDQQFDPLCLVNFLSLSFKSPNMQFPSRFDQEDEAGVLYTVESEILTNVMLLDTKSYHSVNINMSFRCKSRDCDQTAICVFWNFTSNTWSSDGCSTEVVEGVTNCYCNHLTSFSMLLSNILPEGLLNISILDYITNIGLLISIASLVLCISLQVYLMKMTMNLVAYYRHVSILNVSVFLLLSNVSFVASNYIRANNYPRLCLALTFCIHYSLISFFCWTLVQSIFLFCRLVFVFHHITKKEFMTLSVVLGYVLPLIIAIGTFLFFSPTNDYRKNNACWLDSKSGASMAFSIPTIVILSGNFIVLLVVIRKLLRPSISEGSNEDEEVVKKLLKAVVFCTPQFGLTWAIGIPLLSDGSSLVLHYLFVLLNPLQGFFIFVFGCLLDKKVMDIVKKRLSKSPVFSSTATTVSSY